MTEEEFIENELYLEDPQEVAHGVFEDLPDFDSEEVSEAFFDYHSDEDMPYDPDEEDIPF